MSLVYRLSHPLFPLLVLHFCCAGVSAEDKPKGLVAGSMKVSKEKSLKHGPSQVKLVKVWKLGDKKHSYYDDWISDKYGKNKSVLRLKIEGTNYFLLLIDGKVSPFIESRGPYELWKIEGLEKQCKSSTTIIMKAKKIKLVSHGGDMRAILIFDFNKDFKIVYQEEYDWF